MEPIVVRNLPPGITAALRSRAQAHACSVEAEVRRILADYLSESEPTLVDLLAADDGSDIRFDPGRLGSTARTPFL